MTKVTKKDNFNAIVDILVAGGHNDLAEVMRHEIALVEKKNSYKSTKPTATQVANEGIKADIATALADGKAYTASEIVKAVNPELSNQRVSALLRQMIDEGKVAKTVDKRKSYFTLV